MKRQNTSYIGMIIYSSTLDTEEKVIDIYGGISWIKIEGRFLLGQSDSYEINSEGGEVTHTLTTSEIPAHSHTYGTLSAYPGAISGGDLCYISQGPTKSTGNTGGGQAHNNMPPYKVVYIW